jgi:hypothetical protein
MKKKKAVILYFTENVLLDLYETIRGGEKYFIINSYFFNRIACNHL